MEGEKKYKASSLLGENKCTNKPHLAYGRLGHTEQSPNMFREYLLPKKINKKQALKIRSLVLIS